MATDTLEKNTAAPAPTTEPEVEEIATLEELEGKNGRVAKVPVMFPGKSETDKPSRKIVIMKAISAVDYDDLVADCPPTRTQAEKGMNYDPEKFQPALVADCMVQPAMTRDDALRLYKNPRWSGGEFATFFIAAQRLCNVTMDVPFNVSG